MYSRESAFQGSYDPQAVVEQVQRTVLPGATTLSGFRGIRVVGDRAGGRVWFYTDWGTPEALIASRNDADDLRARSAEELGLTLRGVREWHVPAEAVSDQSPAPGLPINVNRHLYDPSIIHEVVSYFVWAAEPMYRSASGFREVRMLVDRTTGEVQVESVWDDVQSLENGFTSTAGVRDRAVEQGMKFVERTQRELLFRQVG